MEGSIYQSPELSESDWEANPHKEELEKDLEAHFHEAAAMDDPTRRHWQIEELYGAALSSEMPMTVINGIYSTVRHSLDNPDLLDDFRYEESDGVHRQVWPAPHHGGAAQDVWYPPAKEE